MSDAGSGAADDVAAYWDGKYRGGGELWGETPSELAAIAVARLGALGPAAAALTLLDLGCGYGRDAVALWDALRLSVVGIDGAARAIEMARAARPAQATIEYIVADLGDLGEVGDLGEAGETSAAGGSPAGLRPARFDAVYCSNVYHLLDTAGRAALRATVNDHLAPGGLFFMSTLSHRDPQHAGRGRPVPGEPDSYVEQTYLHLCRRDELERDFEFLRLERLDEIAYLEPRPEGAPHDHVSWIVVGRAP
ncbi:MAG TPA: class I SAM-dependent methyltransferase [Thermoleophilia bacterium]|nr:class I SAM-dependent methyltransferase [Thermoleophilia bacterium]